MHYMRNNADGLFRGGGKATRVSCAKQAPGHVRSWKGIAFRGGILEYVLHKQPSCHTTTVKPKLSSITVCYCILLPIGIDHTLYMYIYYYSVSY
jgi:hypothetical protein